VDPWRRPSAVVAALLLTLKASLHRLARAVSEDEILAILKFGVVALIAGGARVRRAGGPDDRRAACLIRPDVAILAFIGA